jgi:hypothetical protein
MIPLIQAIVDFFTSLVGILSSALGFVIALLLYILTHPEKLDTWHSVLARAASYWSDRAEGASVSADIQAQINAFAKNANKETLGAMPYGIKVEWTKGATREAVIQSGEVIVRMRRHSNQPKNIVYAAMAYVSKGFLPHGRHYLDEKTARAADHITTRKIFVQRNLGDTLRLYVSGVLEPEIRKGSTVEKYCMIFEKLDRSEFFTRIFSHEIERLGLSLYPAVASHELLNETDQFVDFLRKVVEKAPGERIPEGTLFVGPRFRMAIALIAREDVLAESGVAPHLWWITGCWEKGADTVYICGGKSSNVVAVRDIVKALMATGTVEKVSEHEGMVCDSGGSLVPGVISVMRRKAS